MVGMSYTPSKYDGNDYGKILCLISNVSKTNNAIRIKRRTKRYLFRAKSNGSSIYIWKTNAFTRHENIAT